MGSERLYRTEGIVMQRRNQGEADRVLTLCTPALGKIQIIVKGARKTRSRKAGHIELFARSHFVISRVKHSWDIVSQAEMIDPNTVLRSDLLRGAYARYVIELLDRFFTEGEGGRALFDLLNHTLTWLCQDEDLHLITRFYEQHMLGLAGFRPELFRCVNEQRHRNNPHILRPHPSTQEKVERERHPHGFDPELGGALCPTCYTRRKQMPAVLPLSPQGLYFLQACQRGPYSRLRDRTNPLASPLQAEVERVMHHYITYHLEQNVRAITFLQQLEQ